jgi:hypothetical protein
MHQVKEGTNEGMVAMMQPQPQPHLLAATENEESAVMVIQFRQQQPIATTTVRRGMAMMAQL